jgi:hypothetical protein
MLNKKFLVLGFLNLFFIAGCTSKPDVTNIESNLTAQWSNCESFKVINIKKTNGIERGDKYQIDISYNIEATKNVTANSLGIFRVILNGCPAITTVNGLLSVIVEDIGKRIGRGESEITVGEILVPKGTSYESNNSYLMIKSEKGWIVQ